MANPQRQLGALPAAIRVREVKTTDLIANPHNPRLLFDREPLNTLKESIEKVGILVPLTVYRSRGSDKYTILDGQRRWMCALELNKPTVPINEVAEPTVAQNIVTMFQIHKLRADWELMPTALKLHVLMNELDEIRDKRLADLTRLDVAVVVRCKKLLWYPKKYQQMMLFPEPHQRVKADFFIELYPIVNDRNVRKAPWYDRDGLIDRMLDKYQNRKSGLRSVTDFRTIKQHMTAAARANHTAKVIQRLKEFLSSDDLTITHLEISSATIHKRAEKLSRGIDKLIEELHKVEAQDFYGEEKLWKSLEEMLTVIKKKLLEADRRLK
jgi:ParB family chromosome partitioning protein